LQQWILKNKEGFQAKEEKLPMKKVLVMNGIVKKQEKQDEKVDKAPEAETVISKKIVIARC
jgi:hypothetical protein